MLGISSSNDRVLARDMWPAYPGDEPLPPLGSEIFPNSAYTYNMLLVSHSSRIDERTVENIQAATHHSSSSNTAVAFLHGNRL